MEKHETYVAAEKNIFQYSRGQIVGTNINNCFFSTESPNNFCSIESDIPVKIEEFISEGTCFFRGRRVLSLESFYQEPVKSADLGICRTKLDYGEIEKFHLLDIKYKFICLPIENEFILMPILHSCLPNA